MPKGTTLTSYDPSLRDNIAWALSDMFGGGDRGRVNYINKKVRGAVDFAPVLGDAVGFDEAKRDFDAGNYGSAALNAGASAIGTIPGVGDAAAAGLKAGGNALGMFIGPMAKNWNPAKGLDAELKRTQGELPIDIWKDTGVVFGKDGKARSEISDAGAKLNVPQGGFMGDKLGSLLDHPELFDNYPELRDVRVEDIPGGSNGGLGAFYRSGYYGRGNTEPVLAARSQYFPSGDKFLDEKIDPLSTMLHEIQHYIQAKEGFDPGFSPELAQSTINRKDSYTGVGFNRAVGQWPGKPETQEDLDGILDYLAKGASYETYTRNAGETEARNVQKRAKIPGSNHDIFPNITADRRLNEQITFEDILYGRYDEGLNKTGDIRGSLVDPEDEENYFGFQDWMHGLDMSGGYK